MISLSSLEALFMVEVKITYCYHSCFLLEIGGKTFLFDYAGRGISKKLKENIKSRIKSKELYIFFSHSHGDHFSSEVTEFLHLPEESYCIISNDISPASLRRSENEKNQAFITQVEPDRKYEVDDLKVRSFLSNDEGVAYLIDVDGKKIYFGGDLAKWNWPEWDQKKVKEHVDIFEDALTRLEKENIHVGFSNMDERLPSWAGPVEFIERVKPKYFVPIHTFGNEEWIDDLLKKKPEGTKKIFNYEKPGDQIGWNI